MDLKFLIFLQLLSFSTVNCAEKFKEGTRLHSTACKSNNSIIVVNYCYMKAISRRLVTLNVGVNILKSLKKPIYIQMILYYRYGLIFREVINTNKREWCEIMNGKSTHLFITQSIAQIEASVPVLFHKCPYEGLLEFKNMTIDEKKAFDVFPEGTYKTATMIFDKIDNDAIFSINSTFLIKSHIKESLG